MGGLGINRAIEHVLMKLDKETRSSVREELELEEYETLCETKDTLFNLAKDIYEQVLRKEKLIDENEQIKITAQKRQKTNHSQLADDVIDLFEYIRGNLVQFPKSVVTKSSLQKLIIVKTAQSIEEAEECQIIAKRAIDNVLDKAKIIEMFNRLDEQEKRINELNDKVREDRQRIETLETELAKVKSMEPLNRSSPNGNNTVKSVQSSSKGIEGSSSDTILQTPSNSKGGLYQAPPPTQPRRPSAEGTKKSEVGQSVITPPKKGAVTHVVHENGIDYTTYLHKVHGWSKTPPTSVSQLSRAYPVNNTQHQVPATAPVLVPDASRPVLSNVTSNHQAAPQSKPPIPVNTHLVTHSTGWGQQQLTHVQPSKVTESQHSQDRTVTQTQANALKGGSTP